MLPNRKAIPVKAIANLFDVNGRATWSTIALVLGIAAIQSICIYAGAVVDDTLWLPNEGDGFLEHYGVWAILATDPLLIIATGFAYRRFQIAINTLPLSTKKQTLKAFDQTVETYLNYINMNKSSIFVYYLLVAFGFLCWLNNIRLTVEPTETYGNDVFDSSQYVWGYYANKVNLFTSWVVVYPIVGFLLVSMSLSIRLILQRLTSANAIALNVLHPDGCYGMRSLGILNLSLILPYVLAYCVVFALLITHENQYFTIIAALVGLTVTMVSASFLTIGPISTLGRKIKDETYAKLEKKSRDYNGNNKTLINRFAFERICYSTARASPYSKWIQTFLSMFRIVPVLLTASRLIV